MNKVTINEVSLQELLRELAVLVTNKRLQETRPLTKNGSVYLRKKDVCDRLGIRTPTLDEYTKKGLLQSYKIGNRVLYKAEEIDRDVEKLKTYKHQRGL